MVLQLSLHAQSLLMFWGFFAAGVQGCTSILIIISGILQAPVAGPRVALLPAVLILFTAIMLFCYLLYSSLNENDPPRLRPGETITI